MADVEKTSMTDDGNSAAENKSRKDCIKTIWEGFGLFTLGFIAFLISFWWAGKVKAIVAIATLFGAGMIGLGTFKLFFGDRFLTAAWIAAGLSAITGLIVTLLGLYLILGEGFM